MEMLHWFENLLRVLFNEDPQPQPQPENDCANQPQDNATESSDDEQISDEESDKELDAGTRTFCEMHADIVSFWENDPIVLSAQSSKKMSSKENKIPQQPTDNSKKDDSGENDQKFISLLSNLNLDPQKKLTLMKARTVDDYTLSDKALTSPDAIPKYILQKIMIVDYHARAFKLNTNRQESSESTLRSNEKTKDDARISVNPMDAFLALFHCCDDFLRQHLVIKLCACQLSVPFLLPHPDQPSENITMLLLALDGIKKSWKAMEGTTPMAHQVFVMEHPFPIVSFIRIGQNEMSKSYLLNKVISDVNGYHDFFFHKDCRGGGVERKIVDGLVELCWYLPGGREQQAFEQEICFANLRGDARTFSKQFNVLSEISSVLIFFLPSEYPDRSTQEILEKAVKVSGKLVLVFKEERQENTKKYFDDLYSKNKDKVSTITRAVESNQDDFVVAIREKIRKYAKDAKSVPLKTLSSLANKNKILIDTSASEIETSWHKNIIEWFKNGPTKAKNKLKLQSKVPTIADLERENVRPTRRGNKSQGEYSNDIGKKIKSAKKRQKDSLKKMDKEVSRCLNHIPSMNENERNYSLMILNHYLDKMSLVVLGPLQARYCQMLRGTKKSKKEKKQQECRDENSLEELEKDIRKNSFGLEHIFREMAQIIEIQQQSSTDYAGAAAQMLLSGRSLELMDGDSSYISLKWFAAVFGKLKTITNKKKIFGKKNAKIFVISVLGIQSSGKSTLLNTMFGLEFPVSAGRCTRGAFASLIPLSDSLRHTSGYDYLLVIDTEGLKGSADPQLRQHDNKLATFAIGVADLTIVNIFGENYNEMKEFLEIAVQAFLKMKLVKEKRVCQIVHQNVTDINASNFLAVDRITLRKYLDEMTKLAALQENCAGEFEELNDVISFDENEDVFYIPSILQGSSPMGPVSPEYGKAVQKVKEKIVKMMCHSERSPLTIDQFRTRVKDLWHAILRENFIFNFRNTIEIRAYTSLDEKFLEESVKTIVTEMAAMEKEISVALKRSSPQSREEVWIKYKMQIPDKAETQAEKMRSNMTQFFENHEYKATLETWRENTMIRIDQLKLNHKSEVERNCRRIFRHLKNREEIDQMKLEYKKKLLDNAKKLVTSVQASDDLNDYEKIFQEGWSSWIEQVPQNTVIRTDVEKVMKDVLCEGKQRLNEVIRSRLQTSRDLQINDFYFPSLQLDMKTSNSWRAVAVAVAISYIYPKYEYPQNHQEATSIVKNAAISAIAFAKEIQSSTGHCTKADIQKLYQQILANLESQDVPRSFSFKHESKAETLLYIFGRCYHIFEKMEDEYCREHDIQLDLETNLKPDLKTYFLNKCNKIEKEVSAASLFVEGLKKPIQLELNQSMGTAVANELLKRCEYQSKGRFHATVLIELGEKNKFSSYVDYLRNPVEFLKHQLQESIKTYCTAVRETNSSVISLLEKEIKKIEVVLFSAIENVNEQVGKEYTGINGWIEEFVKNCTKLVLTRDIFSVATIDEGLKDFDVFENEVKKNLIGVLQQFLDQGVNESVLRQWNPTPFDKIVDLIFGCDKYCVFCGALCDQTMKDHPSQHSTKIHRPIGITGYHNSYSKILVKEICTTRVAGEMKFQNVDTSKKYHPYKDYQTVNDYYKSWSIPPETAFEASLYWKWFMATYSNELSKHYKTEKADIPSAWKDISFFEAKKQLQEEYNFA